MRKEMGILRYGGGRVCREVKKETSRFPHLVERELASAAARLAQHFGTSAPTIQRAHIIFCWRVILRRGL